MHSFFLPWTYPEQFANSRKVIISKQNISTFYMYSKPVSYLAWLITMTILKGERETGPTEPVLPAWQVAIATIFVTRTGFLPGEEPLRLSEPVLTCSSQNQILFNIAGSNHHGNQKLSHIKHFCLQPWLSEPVWVRYVYLAATTTATRTGFLTFLRLGWSNSVDTTPSRIPDTGK